MPRIFDNINQPLLSALQETLKFSERADFCVGYFNLRGWRHISESINHWPGGEGHCCRLLVGMHVSPTDTLRKLLSLRGDMNDDLDNQTAFREKRRIAEEFRQQLTIGAPTNDDETSLRLLSAQIRTAKLVVKVYLRHPLHAKLYLLYRQDINNPVTGFLGSSNLTFAGLVKQGELNVDVLEHDACNKLVSWFEDRWHDRLCLDISQELAEIIDTSWAGERLIPPYHVYLKMAYHLAQDARTGLSEFRIPAIFGEMLFDFQIAAVKIAAHHLHKRRGVLLGDVVGLGKSIIATALAKVFEDDYYTETLIICPKNLVSMWEDYVHRYRLHAKVLSLSKVLSELPEKTRRYRLVLIDESHNLRNKAGKRWKVIHDYIERNDSLTVLLSATPYNKSYRDLAAQLALFLKEDTHLGIRPEKLLSSLGGESQFSAQHQCAIHSLAAFEKSEFADDWRDLMRLYMVRRTRSFILQHYAHEDERGRYLLFPDGRRSYFPQRVPKNLTFQIDDNDPNDPYARFYSDTVVNTINALRLPRYGLANYLLEKQKKSLPQQHAHIIKDLSRAGTRLMGFCRVNLFKRLESAGPAFLLSIERHILRNFIVLYAIEEGLEIPLGAQGAELLDSLYTDEDAEAIVRDKNDDADDAIVDDLATLNALSAEADYRARAAKAYALYSGSLKKRFKWLPSSLFEKKLAKHLLNDARALLAVLHHCGVWQPENDTKLNALVELVTQHHPHDKVLIFTQFADTARYLKTQLIARGIEQVAEATGQSIDPTALAWRFAPVANAKQQTVTAADELRVLIATDVLSEGQNLQDAHIVVNYDLPWAIIRLIQRAGRVDRIGQQSDTISCYSFMPADGVERLIQLRARVQQRLTENSEVVGSDERFFDDEQDSARMRDLYTEKNGILDDEEDMEVDLSSYAYQIWKNATDADPSLTARIEAMPNVVYATKAHEQTPLAPSGVLVYMRTTQDNDTLAWIDEKGQSVTQSQLTILKAAACTADTPPVPRIELHHQLTQDGLKHIVKEERISNGQLGRPSGVRFKLYERLKRLRLAFGEKRDLLMTDDYMRRFDRTLEEIYNHPLHVSARETVGRQLKLGIDDHQLLDLAFALREDGRLCVIEEHDQEREVQLICSLGLAKSTS
ncbi:PLD-like domain-containing protein [Allochromatium warmingii]|uniref:PLD-like domain-containing protein n=1 Tax=Allochromatium warmingii TaxID=61595 RepID=A0A1H3EJX0_ALLWA|nr:helicase-related protein [Allochromatium warmingii]SDX78224.1 PLD-like domain-containing protein [Allochromatium warmingii]